MKKYVFIICLLLCLTGCTTHVNLNTPEQTQEQTTSEYTTQENIIEDCTTQEKVTQENTIQNNTTLIDNELLEYNDAKITWKLEYPVLNSENDQYDKVNTLLVDEIKKLTELPYVAKEFEGRFYYTGKYKIFEQSSDVISLCYVMMWVSKVH